MSLARFGFAVGWPMTFEAKPNKKICVSRQGAARVFEMKFKRRLKALGFWGFLFFLLKGMLWLAIPALAAILVD